MKLFVLYSSQLLLNYNKTLLIEQFKRQHDLYKNNNLDVNLCVFGDDYLSFYSTLYETILNNKDAYKESIFWMHLKIGSYTLLMEKFTTLYKALGIKTIFWMDDLHFAGENMEKDERYVYTDLIISPSTTYFHNIHACFLHKTEFLFYYFDEALLGFYDPKLSFEKRKNQILLTGHITEAYSSRQQMLDNSYNNTSLYTVLIHPGYYNMTHKFYHKEYFDKMSEYKGSMVGLADFPLNFLLGKVIETIGSGCLGFFEESPLYKKELGLEPWIHYVPIERNKYGKLLLEDASYTELLFSNKGKKIAVAAYAYVKEHYTSFTCATKIIKIIENRFVTKPILL